MKLKRTLIAILIGIMNLNLWSSESRVKLACLCRVATQTCVENINSAYAQTDSEFWAEEFLAEVFYGDMTEKSPKVYLEKRTKLPFSLNVILKEDILVSSYNVADDVFEITSEEYFNPKMWKENAPVFQQPKYRKLIFVDDISKLSKKEQKKAEKRIFSKPVFSKCGQYALVETGYYSRNRIWKPCWSCFPHKDFWKARYLSTHSVYHELYQRIDNKWARIDEWYVGGGHN